MTLTKKIYTMSYSNEYLSTKNIIIGGKNKKTKMKKSRKKAKNKIYRNISKKLIILYKKGYENRTLRLVSQPKAGWAN